MRVHFPQDSVIVVYDLDVVFCICFVPILQFTRESVLLILTLVWIRDTAGIRFHRA